MNQTLMFTTTFIIQFIIAMEMNFIGPLAPYLADYFGIRDSQVILFNLGYSAVGILVPLFGVWADRYGNKRLISYSLLLFLAGSIVSGFAPTAIIFAIGRILIGLGYFSLSGSLMSYISEFIDYRNRGKASGILRTAFGVALLGSPLYTAYMTSTFDNLISIYLPISILAAIAYILLRKLPETEILESSQLNMDEFIAILKHPRTVKVLLSLFLVISAPVNMFNYLGLYLSSEFSLTQGQIGISYSLIAAGTVLGIFVATLFSDKIGKLTFSRIAFTIMVFGLFPIPYVGSVVLIIALAFTFAFGLDGGWTAYQAFSSEIQPGKRGTFLALYYTINAATVTIYSLIGPLLYDFGGMKLTTGVGFGSSLIALIILFRLSRSPA
ncbi:MFS transporter [Gudongella sp. DL1XJH-153]|uniref:MFS transporter n=1 Tax=Gudongella sp. DL1XJH-153 TaxID=3409804 RepID=UPI003BB6DBE3